MNETLKAAKVAVAAIQERERQEREARGEPVIRVYTLSELQEQPDELRYFEIGDELLIYWGGFEYPIALDRIDTPLKLVSWLRHVGEKGWELCDGVQIALLIEDLGRHFGWDVYSSV